MNKNENSKDFNRRDFLRGASFASLMAMMGGIELRADNAPAPAGTNAEPALTAVPVGPTVKYGIIGLGQWGREVIATLGKLPNAPVVAICEKYPAFLRRASEAAPKAEKFEDYTKLLASKEVQAVVIATPTHQHREIVEAALKAGKHVYCEAPIAHSVEDAKAIAKAAKAAPKCVFQSGLQNRSHAQRAFCLKFVRSGATGKNVMARAQWHKKQSWVRNSPNPEREKELNWRLHKDVSTGLAGEVGVHLFDTASWFIKQRPVAVTGFGSTIRWNDGRDVPDTVQAMVEYPNGVNFMFDASLASSFDAEYEVYHGTDAAIMYRNNKAWLFKEVDSPLLGWEVYARKDIFFDETGIALLANASKQAAISKSATVDSPFPESNLYYALEAFTFNAGTIGQAVEDFVSSFGDSDLQALQENLATLKTFPAAGWKEGLESTVLAIKANEAIMKKGRVELPNELFEI